MTHMLSTGALVLLLGAATFAAQSAQNPYSTMVRDGWNSLKKNLSASAAKMADADYAFKPTPQVRSFGQILGHLANEHYLICAAVKGEKSPNDHRLREGDRRRQSSSPPSTSRLPTAMAPTRR